MKKKKFLCVLLVLLLCFSSTISAYASTSDNNDDEILGFSSKMGEVIAKIVLTPANLGFSIAETVDDYIKQKTSDWIQRGWITNDNKNYTFSSDVVNDLNNYMQSQIRALDGYYLITPKYDFSYNTLVNFKSAENWSLTTQSDFYNSFHRFDIAIFYQYSYWHYYTTFDFEHMAFFCKSGKVGIVTDSYYDKNEPFQSGFATRWDKPTQSFEILTDSWNKYDDSMPYGNEKYFNNLVNDSLTFRHIVGSPFKLFYSEKDAKNYFNNGRSYIPSLPSSGFSLPKKYIDNPTLLPDITYNIDKSNKTEEVIQNEYNTIINNYITNIDGSGGSGGDSGGSGGDSGGGSGGGNITDTELYDFLTKLWNESDKKFDKMIDLLETNNKYQKKLVDSLNDIKAILVTQTVFDAFKNRSTETANKAKEKFPTSIPWDVAMILNAMSAEPQELKFSLPIQVKSFGINESIEIDLSSEEWTKLAKTCRYLLSISFILILIQLTRKLFSSGGDD